MSKEFDYPRDFKGIWLPKEIWLDDELNATDKIIFAEINSLDVEESEGCYASNEYLANFCKCSVTKVSTSISKLIGLGYIKVAKTDGRKKWLKTSLSKFESQTLKNEKPEIQEMKESNIPSNKDDKNSDKNSIKYAFSDKSSKADMYASVSEKREAEQKPQKKNRYIPKDYTEEQLKEHVKPVIDNYIDRNCDKLNKDELKSNLLEIIAEFHREYEKNFGEKHRILADASYENIAERYLKPPSTLKDIYETDAYSAMIEQYFIVEFNKRKKYNKPIEISLSHFMSDEIRGHLYWQTCV